MVSGIIVMPASQSIGVVVIGALLALHPRSPSRSKPPPRFLLAGLAGALLFFLWFPVIGHLDRLESAEKTVAAAEGDLNPRFWLQGRLDLPPWQDTHLED